MLFSVPEPKWSIDDIPDLTGKVMLVTGGNSGIGKETCRALLRKGAKVWLTARDKAKGEEAVQDLEKDTGKRAHFLVVDLADLTSVRKAAEEFKSQEKSLHVLFNNAGVMVPPIAQLTKDGYDLQFGTNVIGHYVFTKILIPTLIASAQTSGSSSRIIMVSSSVHKRYKGSIQYDLIKDSEKRRKAMSFTLYSHSKFGVVVLGQELARRYLSEGIVAITVDPGNIKTGLQRHNPCIVNFLINVFILYPLPYGALTQLYAGTSKEAEKLNGEYLQPWARLGEASASSKDQKTGEGLWEWLQKNTNA